MEYSDIVLQKRGSVATLVLNRPDKMNSIAVETRNQILQALDEVDDDEDIRVLIFTGNGDRAFCAGADVGGLSARISGDVKDVTRRQVTQRIGWYVPRLREIRVPTIAAINGVAAGIGVSFAAACDIRIASDKARFTCAWVNRGIIPDGAATYLLPQLVGIEKALELCYTGDIIDAQEALRIGLIGRIVPHDELMNVVGDLAAKIADKPPIAVELIKCGIYGGLESDIKIAIDYESYAQNVCRNTEDHKEGVQSFLEKRRPEFKGR